MRRRNSASFAMPTYAARDATSVSWGYFILTVACACVLAAGFFLAARQHFNTMEFGFKNGKLRNQVEDLQTEKRRLMLAREVSLSPAEIKRAAKNLGFRDRGEVAVVSIKAAERSSNVSQNNFSALTVATSPRKSAATKPIKVSLTEQSPKAAVEDKTIKRIVMQKARKDGDDFRILAIAR